MALDNFRVAPLPNPPAQYDAQYLRQFIRVLETYFSQLDSRAPCNAEQYSADRFVGGDFIGNGKGIYTPYNEFYSYADQTLPAIDQAVPVEFDGTTFTNGVYVAGVDDTQITFTEPGIYNIVPNLCFVNPTTDPHAVDFWLRVSSGGGTDVANSNRKFTIPARRSAGAFSHLVVSAAYTVSVDTAGIFYEVMWTATSTSVAMEHVDPVAYSAGVTPAIPGTPSASVQVSFVSRAV